MLVSKKTYEMVKTQAENWIKWAKISQAVSNLLTTTEDYQKKNDRRNSITFSFLA